MSRWLVSLRRAAPAMVIAVHLAAAAALAPTAARAEPSPAEKETARSLMKEGDGKLARSDADGALRAYRAADAIMGVPTTKLAVARALEALGQLLEAREAALVVARMHPEPNEPQPFANARTEATALAARLAERIPSIVVKPPDTFGGEGAVIRVDGAPLPPEAVGAPWKVNPGVHEVRASTHGGLEAGERVTVQEGETRVVALALPSEAAAPPSVEARGPRISPVAYAGFGLAAAGLVAGSITGALTLAKASSIKEQCAGTDCSPAVDGDLHTANTLAKIADVSFAVAAVGVAVGVIGIVLSDGGRRHKTAALVSF